MTGPIRISFQNSDKQVVAAMRTRGPRLQSVLRQTLDELMIELLIRVQRKLSGEVLQPRSGKLLRSAHKEPTVVRGAEIVGGVSAAGGPAFYGRILHAGVDREYIIEPKNKKALAFFPSGSAGAGKLRVEGRRLFFKMGSRRGSMRPGMGGKFAELGGVVVRRVTMPPQPARPYMTDALEEMRRRIVADIYGAAARAIQ